MLSAAFELCRLFGRGEKRDRERQTEREREREIVERRVRAMQVAVVAAAICIRVHCVAFNWIRLA